MIPTIQRAVLEGLLSSLSAGHCLNRGLYPALSQAQTSTLSFIRTISHEATIVPDEGQPSTIVPTSPDVAHASRSPKRQSPMTKKKYLCSKGTDGRHVHLLRYHQEAASYHGGIQQHADTLRVLRRYNYSLPALKGQASGDPRGQALQKPAAFTPNPFQLEGVVCVSQLAGHPSSRSACIKSEGAC